MNIYVDPRTLATEWDPYWLTSILVEYDIEHDPDIQAYHRKQQEKANKATEAERQRAESRTRAGDNHLRSIEDQQ